MGKKGQNWAGLGSNSLQISDLGNPQKPKYCLSMKKANPLSRLDYTE